MYRQGPFSQTATMIPVMLWRPKLMRCQSGCTTPRYHSTVIANSFMVEEKEKVHTGSWNQDKGELWHSSRSNSSHTKSIGYKIGYMNISLIPDVSLDKKSTMVWCDSNG